jgi:hypothetical protein
MRRANHTCLVVLLAAVATGLVEAAPPQPIASAPTNWNGVTIDLMAVQRKGSVLTVKWAVHNGGSSQTEVSFPLTGEGPTTYVVDEDAGTKYYVLTDKEKHALASMSEWTGSNTYGIKEWIKPGETKWYWMKLPAPPPQVKTLTIFFSNSQPFEDVAITDN